jgi:hypothetical protein
MISPLRPARRSAFVDPHDPSHGLRRETTMDKLCWLLIGLAALAFAMGACLAFTHGTYLLAPVGFWRGAIGLLLFAIALRLMDRPAAAK